MHLFFYGLAAGVVFDEIFTRLLNWYRKSQAQRHSLIHPELRPVPPPREWM